MTSRHGDRRSDRGYGLLLNPQLLFPALRRVEMASMTMRTKKHDDLRSRARFRTRYSGYDELAVYEKEGIDYRIELQPGRSGVAVMAPHGGRIEPGTAHIARAVAGMDHTYYGFVGVKPRNNRALHLASTRFDEPLGVEAAARAQLVMTIHGCSGREALVHVGGRHEPLRQAVAEGLREAGFAAGTSPEPALRGVSPRNLCNRCQGGRGVQLELTLGLRLGLYEDLRADGDSRTTSLFAAFVGALRGLLAMHLEQR